LFTDDHPFKNKYAFANKKGENEKSNKNIHIEFLMRKKKHVTEKINGDVTRRSKTDKVLSKDAYNDQQKPMSQATGLSLSIQSRCHF